MLLFSGRAKNELKIHLKPQNKNLQSRDLAAIESVRTGHKFGSPARCGFDSSLLSPTAPEDGVILFLVLAGNPQSCVGTIKLGRCLVKRGQSSSSRVSSLQGVADCM